MELKKSAVRKSIEVATAEKMYRRYLKYSQPLFTLHTVACAIYLAMFALFQSASPDLHQSVILQWAFVVSAGIVLFGTIPMMTLLYIDLKMIP